MEISSVVSPEARSYRSSRHITHLSYWWCQLIAASLCWSTMLQWRCGRRRARIQFPSQIPNRTRNTLYVLTTLALILMEPNDWDKHRIHLPAKSSSHWTFFIPPVIARSNQVSPSLPLRRMIIAVGLVCRTTANKLKSFATYRTVTIFFGLIDAFFTHLFEQVYLHPFF